MKRDEIISMALESCAPNQTFNSDEEWVKRFAALVAEPWIKTNKALAKEIIELKEQVEQEPVAWMDENGWASIYKDELYTRPLYAHPVRTKDLTDDEIEKIFKSYIGKQYDEFARSVIAADREKNK